jgi:Fe-S-cluster-containing hydrogenase component 2
MEKDCLEACPVDALSVVGEKLVIDEAECLGCGLCIPSCPKGALSLELRDAPPKVYKNNDALFRQIYAESALGLIGRKLGLGR